MACPFGFSGPKAPESDCDGDIDSVDSEDDVKGGPRLAKQSADGPGPAAGGDDRFDYHKDPVSWFFQNQIKSEEEFQARKAELRATARARLHEIFEKKGKRLLVDSEDEGFSVCSSELSAWDSDVASISSLADCAREWREGAHFCAPGGAALQLALVTAAVAAAHCCWRSLQALLAVNRYWGILKHGWAPMASFLTAVVLTVVAGSCWLLMGRARKRSMLGFQIALQLLYVATAGIALATYSFPVEIDLDLKASACVPRAGAESLTTRLCQYLPAIEDEVRAHVSAILTGCAAEAAACAACLALSSWYLWELAYVEKKALKIKRRRRHRKNSIPWERIKVENMGPVTFCGSGGVAAPKPKGAAAGGGGGGGGCPFAQMAAGGGEKKTN